MSVGEVCLGTSREQSLLGSETPGSEAWLLKLDCHMDICCVAMGNLLTFSEPSLIIDCCVGPTPPDAI